jgi:hypothetical protein
MAALRKACVSRDIKTNELAGKIFEDELDHGLML